MEASWTSTVAPFCFETTKQFNQVQKWNAGGALQVRRLDFQSWYTDWSLLHSPGANFTLWSSTLEAETVQWHATVSECINAPSQGCRLAEVTELWPRWKNGSKESNWMTLAPNKNTVEGFKQKGDLQDRIVAQDLGNWWSRTSTSLSSCETVLQPFCTSPAKQG